MRALLAVLLLTPCFALADPPLYTELTDSPPATPVAAPQALDDVRLFNTIEVFHLAPSDVRTELRGFDGVPGSDPTLEVRAEVGLTPHFQLSMAQDIADSDSSGSLQPSGTPIALRYSLGAHPGDVVGNPAIEAELTPRPNAPARGAVRLLAATELAPHLVLVGNAYLEQNLNRETSVGVDGALGLTGGASYALLHDHLHLGGEAQVGSAEYGTREYDIVIAAGPNAVFSLGRCAATLTSMVDLATRKVGLEPMGTLGCTF